MKYTLSKQAGRDVKKLIQSSYSNFGFDVTNKYQRGLNNCFSLLASEPSIGVSADSLRSEYRKFPYKSHVVYYKARKKDIFIVRLLHERMNELDHL